MKISSIAVWAIDLPLSRPYWLSGGRLRFERLDSTFVAIDTSDGIRGWGESCPWGHSYLPAHGEGARAALERLGPALIGEDPRALDHVNKVMDVCLPGHPHAKSAIDIACWDILGQAAGMPLWRLMGAARPETVEANSSISTGTPEDMIALIEEARSAGYRTHSAKIGGTDPTADIQRIDAIEAARLPGEAITFDVNRAWTPGVAVQVLNSVSARGWIEQPCETLEQCGHVARRVVQPVMLDECLHDLSDHLAAWRAGACEGVKIKPNRLGGLTKARRARDMAIEFGWRLHIEDTGGSALADTAAMHLAASTPEENRLASWLCHPHLSVDPVPGQGSRNVSGMVSVPTVPGLGVAPSLDLLGEPAAVFR